MRGYGGLEVGLEAALEGCDLILNRAQLLIYVWLGVLTLGLHAAYHVGKVVTAVLVLNELVEVAEVVARVKKRGLTLRLGQERIVVAVGCDRVLRGARQRVLVGVDVTKFEVLVHFYIAAVRLVLLRLVRFAEVLDQDVGRLLSRRQPVGSPAEGSLRVGADRNLLPRHFEGNLRLLDRVLILPHFVLQAVLAPIFALISFMEQVQLSWLWRTVRIVRHSDRQKLGHEHLRVLEKIDDFAGAKPAPRHYLLQFLHKAKILSPTKLNQSSSKSSKSAWATLRPHHCLKLRTHAKPSITILNAQYRIDSLASCIRLSCF